jgi:DNA topoisomerase I
MAVLPESLSVKIRVGARSHFIPVEADAARKHKPLVQLLRSGSGGKNHMAGVHRRQNAKITRLTGRADLLKSATTSGLRYVMDDSPGITRMRNGHGFCYWDPRRRPLRQAEDLRRIKSLAIPPAWKQVWISPLANAHLQATGRDAKGRKQHRYHPRWREVRDQTKYDRMITFCQALPRLRARVNRDLTRPGLPRIKIIAAVVKLLETTLIRIGSEEYARQNGSFGLTTMRNRHVRVQGTKIRFEFRGKSGVKFNLDLDDKRLARIVKRCQDLPGQELFQYIDEEGKRRTIASNDVNEYLRNVTRDDFTAKDFRTWAGTLLAVRALGEIARTGTQVPTRRNVVKAIETVAKKLGNTRAVCRKSYIHPAVVDAYLDGSLADTLKQTAPCETGEARGKLRREEVAVIAILEQRLKTDSKRRRAA